MTVSKKHFFFDLPDGGGMPMFNEMFVFLYSNAFIKLMNMYPVGPSLPFNKTRRTIMSGLPNTDG